jgi:PKD repeat protein
MIFSLAWGGANNPVLVAWNIDPYYLKESLQMISMYAFLGLSGILFVFLSFGIFRILSAKKDEKEKRKGGAMLSLFSFGCLFLTVIVWMGMYSYIERFVVNAEVPDAEIAFSPSQAEILQMEPPVELRLSAKKIREQWLRKGKTIESYAWDLTNDGVYEYKTREDEFSQLFFQSGETSLSLLIDFTDGTQEKLSKTLQLPDSVFSYSPKRGEVPLEVSFDAKNLQSPQNMITEYAWDFNNDSEFDSVSDKSTVKHIFTRIGEHTVKLRTRTATNRIEYYTAKITVSASTSGTGEVISAQMKITPEKKEGDAPFTLFFSAENSFSPLGAITSYVWDFGDGSFPKRVKETQYTFDTPGEYTVSLTVQNQNGDSAEATETIRVLSPEKAPEAVITISPNQKQGYAPLTLKFSGLSSTDTNNDIVSYAWDFTGNSVFDVITPEYEHTFREAGVYPVSLKVTDATGVSTVVSIDIEVLDYDLTPRLDANPEAGEVPLTVSFDASKSFYRNGQIVSYEWDFGDGSPKIHSGAVQNHRYMKVGEYTAKVIVHTDDGLSAHTVKKVFVRVKSTQACFQASRNSFVLSSSPQENEVSFYSTCSLGEITQWKWTFGEESISREKDPSYIFREKGLHTVTLEVTDVNNAISEYSTVIEVR